MSTSATTASNLFIDLATYSETEGFLYGGPEAITWFVRTVQKANWFSFIPLSLRQQGTFAFGQRNSSAIVNRSGDYVLDVWFRCQIPQVICDQTVPPTVSTSAAYAWTRNLMHNLIERCSITFNELVVHEFDSNWLDYNFEFRCRGSKRLGYRNMIGDIAAMTLQVAPANVLGTGGFFSVPLPFFFTEDSGVALPVAALPFNDIKINYTFRALANLLYVNPGLSTDGTQIQLSNIHVVGGTAAPEMQEAATFSHYAVVHNDERVAMGDAPRDMLIRQVQNTQQQSFTNAVSGARQSFDLRLSHAMIAIFFAMKNTTLAGLQSNYTTEPHYAGLDPISFSTLIYENTTRVAMGSDYYSLMCPWYVSDAIPEETGYHMYSYAIHPWLQDPSGSTNYSKLANVSLAHDPSPAATNAANVAAPTNSAGGLIREPVFGTLGAPAPLSPQTFVHVFESCNWNIVRVANGSLGLPVL